MSIFNYDCSNLPIIKGADYQISYRQLKDKLDKWSQILKNWEERYIGILAEQSPEVLILITVLVHLNAKIFLIPPRIPSTYLSWCIQHSGVDALVGSQSTLRMFEEVSIQKVSFQDIENGNVTIDTKSCPKLFPQGPCFVIMTSGSQGQPKFVVLTLDNVLTNARWSNQNLPFLPGDMWLLSLSLYHISGLAIWFRTLTAGATVYISSKKWWEDSIDNNVTHISVVSTLLWRLLRQGRYKHLKQLKSILIGGGPIPEKLVLECYQLGLPIYTTYGLTEMASQVTTTKTQDTLQHLLTAGSPLQPDTVRVDDDGVISVTGPCRFYGYISDKSLEQPFSEQGWFKTQDLGEWTHDGYLRIKGRKDNVFQCGGENIQPEEIEMCTLSSGLVEEVVVVPFRDEEYGMVPIAIVKYSREGNENNLLRFLSEHLPRIKIPRKFIPFPEFAINEGIKVSRKKIIDWVNQGNIQ